MAREESGGAEHPPGNGPAEARTPVDRTQSALAEAISDAKERIGLSQREIGRRIGVDQTVVSTWVRGVATPSVERILALDRLFGLRPGTLLERAGLVRPRTTEEAIAAETAINDDDKSLLQGIVASRRRTTHPPAPTDDLFLLSRERLQEAVDKAVTRALAVRRTVARPAGTTTSFEDGAPLPSRPLPGLGNPYGHRHRRHINGDRPPTSDGGHKRVTGD